MYFTGRPCKHGHVALRCTANGCCIECSKRIQKQVITKRLLNNPNLYKEQYAKDPERFKRQAAKYRANNPEKVLATSRASMLKRKPLKAAYQMKRQANKLNATPHWLSQEHHEQIKLVYVEAKRTSELAGFKCHVDHIVPLQGKDVCGLHVPWNLRVVSRSYNIAKKNNLDDGVLFPPLMSGRVLTHSSALPWNWSTK